MEETPFELSRRETLIVVAGPMVGLSLAAVQQTTRLVADAQRARGATSMVSVNVAVGLAAAILRLYDAIGDWSREAVVEVAAAPAIGAMSVTRGCRNRERGRV